ncbi:MAG TPA: TetR/AcrR family transcriptional regulator [Myxococcaceae bacterium]|nr:TetR/AcrR family transcriptional regulator [Myxococcaceae bacterium]
MARPRSSATPQRILDVAERLIQTRGFNGFSYADVSAGVGITKASLHYHFPTKAELGLSLIRRYQVSFSEALRTLDESGGDPRALLEGYVQIYASVLRKDRMCLCGMLAAEHSTLPRPMQQALRLFFDGNERWLGGVLRSGERMGALRLRGSVRDEARLLVAALEGALLVARSYDDPGRFETAAARILETIQVTGTSKGLARRPRVGRRSGRTPVRRAREGT